MELPDVSACGRVKLEEIWTRLPFQVIAIASLRNSIVFGGCETCRSLGSCQARRCCKHWTSDEKGLLDERRTRGQLLFAPVLLPASCYLCNLLFSMAACLLALQVSMAHLAQRWIEPCCTRF
jgi:hypothetical protein